MDRRRFLLAGGCATAVGTAGCLDVASLLDEDPEERDSGETGDGEDDPGESEAVPGESEADPEVPDAVDGAWLRPEYDAGRTNYAPETAGPSDPVAELWSVEVDGDPAVLAVAGERVYAATGGSVHALDALDGDERWEATVDGSADLELRGVVDDRLVLVGDDEVLALGADDGDERWRVDRAVTDAVVAADGTYAVGFVDDEPVVTALDTDGDERWTVEFEGFASTGGVLAGDGRVLAWTHGDVGRWWVLDAADGEVLDERGGGTHVPLPVASRDGTAYRVDPFYGQVAASAIVDGGYTWQTGIEGYGAGHPPAAVGPERLFVAAQDGEPGVFALGTADGDVLWHQGREDEEVDRVVACEETVLVSAADELACLDAADGDERWSVDRDVEWFCVVDDLVYAVRDGGVEALRAA